MDIHNLATVMTPNILYPNTKNSTVDESFQAIEAVNALITYNDTMCEVSSSSTFKNEVLFFLTFFQIPDDLQGILSDPTLFKENAKVTTKEILKRYGDIARGSFSPRPENGGETFTITNSNRNNTTPAASARIEGDPSQDAAWPVQSSVRHVGGPSHSHSNSNAPQAQTGFDFNPPQPAYHRERSGSNGSQPSDGQQQQNLSYRTRPGQGAMGVTG